MIAVLAAVQTSCRDNRFSYLREFNMSFDVVKSDAIDNSVTIRDHFSSRKISNIRELLPTMFSLNGKPYTLNEHFHFEPWFKLNQPNKLIFKTARQVGKSVSAGVQGVCMCSQIPYFNTLHVTPLFEMIRRFSNDIVRKVVDGSPVRRLLIDSTCSRNVMERSYTKGGIQYFSFAFLDCTRIRGMSAGKVHYDEIQDFDHSHIPVINQIMSGYREWGLQQMTGTPKTLDNGIEHEWQKSSMAEFCVKCEACNHWNIPSLDHHFDKMLGVDRPNWKISRERPGVVCYHCSRPLNVRKGRYVHRHPERKGIYEGYHVPQIVAPLHCESDDKWRKILAARRGEGNTQTYEFYNEIGGESYDSASKLVTLTDIKKAATLPNKHNDIAAILPTLNRYITRVLGVDWGGGGMDEVSFTTVALIGMLPNGNIEVPFGWRSLTPHDKAREATRIKQLFTAFKCQKVVHDYCGAGAAQEVILNHAGIDDRDIVPMAYVSNTATWSIRLKEIDLAQGQRPYYQLSKARSLVTLSQMIKLGFIHFFQYDWKSTEEPGLLNDFLNLCENKVGGRVGMDIFTIGHNKLGGPDDFAHSVNYGTSFLFHMHNNWPNIAKAAQVAISESNFTQFENEGWDISSLDELGI